MNGRKSDTAIVSKKPVKTDGEKGCALYSRQYKGSKEFSNADKVVIV